MCADSASMHQSFWMLLFLSYIILSYIINCDIFSVFFTTATGMCP